MFLFQKHHIYLIRIGKKTQTRRNHKQARAKVGVVHQCRTELFGLPHCYIRITRVWQERLGDINNADSHKEGDYTPENYIDGMIEMHKGKLTRSSMLWCYEFELVKEAGS